LLERDDVSGCEKLAFDAPTVHVNEGFEDWFERVELVLVGQRGLIIIQNVDPLV
jgi:hypothetical protein